mgnify:CR=1 FL=1
MIAVAVSLGVLVSLGSAQVYKAETLLYLGQPFTPGGGGQIIRGLYNLVPEKVGPVDELAQSSENFDKQTENWHGVDVNISSRMRNSLMFQGGGGRRLHLTQTASHVEV